MTKHFADNDKFECVSWPSQLSVSCSIYYDGYKLNMVSNCSQHHSCAHNIVVVVASTKILYYNSCVIFNHVYDRIAIIQETTSVPTMSIQIFSPKIKTLEPQIRIFFRYNDQSYLHLTLHWNFRPMSWSTSPLQRSLFPNILDKFMIVEGLNTPK